MIMEKVTVGDLKKLYIPDKSSHKGMNGKLTIIGGSRLFHGASLWALKVASRIVDMVFYASTSENNQLTQKLKTQIFDFIAVPREEVEAYIEESDVILIGPGMIRAEGAEISNFKFQISNLNNILNLKNEGAQTYYLTQYLLQRYPNKKWVIDAGSLQMMEPVWLKWLNGNVIITPHRKEFERLFSDAFHSGGAPSGHPRSVLTALLKKKAEKYGCTILLKGPTDIICSPGKCKIVEGGNPGMTKGGTGDVLAGLVASLACKNDLFLAACAASFINKKAGEELAKKVGYYFNASDLADQIPKTLNHIL